MATNTPYSRPGQNEVTIQAKSLEQALVKASGTLGVTQDEMAYKILRDEQAKGIFSIFKSGLVEIAAWKKNSEQKTAAPASSRGRSSRPARSEDDEDEIQAAPSEPLSPEKAAALAEELRTFCAGICSAIAGESVQVTAQVDDGRLILNVDSEYMSQQFNRNSKLAEAMEHILRKKPRHLKQELPFRIFIDVNGMRRKREDDLIQMAHDLSAKVHENKRPIVLNYKSSYDRKIIHMALDKDARVYTKSIGSGTHRKLMILPIKDNGSNQTPEVAEFD